LGNGNVPKKIGKAPIILCQTASQTRVFSTTPVQTYYKPIRSGNLSYTGIPEHELLKLRPLLERGPGAPAALQPVP